MSDYSEKELLEIDFMIDELENKINILERKIGLTVQNEPIPESQPEEPSAWLKKIVVFCKIYQKVRLYKS